MSKKLDNYARSSLDGWLREHAVCINRSRIDNRNHIEFHSISGTLVAVIDMYSKEDGDYIGFELLTPSSGTSVNDAISELESLLD